MGVAVRRAVQIGSAGSALLVVVSCIQAGNRQENATADAKESLRSSDIAKQMNPEIKGWRYSEQKDEMRGQSTKVAKLQADDYNVYLTPTLVVFRLPNGNRSIQLKGPEVVNGLSIHCDYRAETISVKMDDGPVRKIGCSTGFSVPIDPKLITMLEGSNKMVLEVDTSAGTQQYTFSTAGFKL